MAKIRVKQAEGINLIHYRYQGKPVDAGAPGIKETGRSSLDHGKGIGARNRNQHLDQTASVNHST
jgi:hypothetical protein